jgi:hypothetical protein
MIKIVGITMFGFLCHKYLEGPTKLVFPTPDLNRLVSYVEGTLMIWAAWEVVLNGWGFTATQRNLIRMAFGFAVLFLGGGVVLSYIADALLGKRGEVA